MSATGDRQLVEIVDDWSAKDFAASNNSPSLR
jgi:hypothetical protein